MIFTDLGFFLFFGLVFCVHWALPGNRGRKVWLLLASYAFYSLWDWRFLSLILVSTLVDFVVGRQLARTTARLSRRLWLSLSLGVNLSLLGVFKYLDFFLESTAELLELIGFEPHIQTLGLILPVGISFYTFQTLSYSLDIYFRRLEPADSLLDLATFVAFFPQLVAGPIVRASDFLPQLRARRNFPTKSVRALLVLFLVGFFKKACVSDNITTYVDALYAAPETFGFLTSWIGMILFSVQIYCDFSGYSDMAIACAGLLGYELRLNFDFPYLRSNIQEFWRTWHMSLSAWFRDYVYVPLGGNRGAPWFVNRNTLITMFVAGVWHGAGATFLVFGLGHGVALVVYREFRRARPQPAHPGNLMVFLGTVATFLFVTYIWVFFRAPDFGAALTVTRNILGLGSVDSTHVVYGPIAVILTLALLHAFSGRRVLAPYIERAPAWVFSAGYGVAFPVMLSLMNGAVQPFIYFQF